MAFCLAICGMVLVSAAACATTDRSDPELQARRAKAYAQLNQWYRRFNEFARQADTLVQEIGLLRNHPGWADMEDIIKAAPSIEYLEGTITAERKTVTAIDQWSRRWRAPGEKMITNYIALTERSKELERERMALLNEWGRVYYPWVVTFAGEGLACGIVLCPRERTPGARGD